MWLHRELILTHFAEREGTTEKRDSVYIIGAPFVHTESL